jgi:hypothetical protein
MLPFDSYRDVLSEHGPGRHVVTSAWCIVAVVVVLIVVLTA